MLPKRFTVDVTTDAAGNATAFTDAIDGGQLQTIAYQKDGTNPYSGTQTITVTIDKTGESVWSEANLNASAARAPRQATHSVAGAAALYAAGGTAVNDKIAISKDRFKIAITGGGNTKTGRFHFLVV